MLKLVSKSTKELAAANIKEICHLKNSQWKFGLKSQLKWFKNNIKKHDIHNCVYLKDQLVGYTLLRKRTLMVSNKKINYLLFDSLVIKKKLRKKKLSYLIMLFNNSVIKKKKRISFLMCKNKLINFYKKFYWKKINNSKFSVVDHPFSSNGMIFNYSKNLNGIKNPFKIFINR